MPRLAVITDLGTFTRETSRPYTHVVVAGGRRAEVLEAHRLMSIANFRHQVECYKQGLDTTGVPLTFAPEVVLQWIVDLTRDVEGLEAKGPITQDTVALWQATNWSADKDRAIALAHSDELFSFRTVRVYEVATGRLVQQRTYAPMTPQIVMEHWARRRSIRRRRAGRRTVARF